jgi:hypothetical protein
MSELPRPFISSPTGSNTPDFANTVRGAIKNLPILGNVYALGASVSPQTVKTINDVVTGAPFLSDIAKGGELYNLKKNVDIISPRATPAEYNDTADRFQKASIGMVGSGKNEALATAPIAEPFLNVGKGYRERITAPFSTFLAPLSTNPVTNIVKDAAIGFVSIPGGIVEMVGMSIEGGERVAKHAEHLPGLAAAGGAMQAEGFVSNPVGSTAQLVGTYALLAGGGAAINKGIGLVRTRGQGYVPIEQIGYGPEEGFPLAPKRMTSEQLRGSFERSTLEPTPTKTSRGVDVTHVPANAALPGEAAGKSYMWTAWENSPNKLVGIMDRVRGQNTYVLGRGTSEIPGMYGAPVAESYFTKAGGQMPDTIGFDIGIKKPSLLRTEMSGIDTVPSGLSRQTMAMKAAGVETEPAYAGITRYIQERVAPGRAAMPMTKIEYEAVLQQGNEIQVTQPRYYTKVGGIGREHIGGTRLPIFEQQATGRIVETAPESAISSVSGSGDYSGYRGEALVSAYPLAGSVGINTGSPQLMQTDVFSRKALPTSDSYLDKTQIVSTRNALPSEAPKPLSSIPVSLERSYSLQNIKPDAAKSSGRFGISPSYGSSLFGRSKSLASSGKESHGGVSSLEMVSTPAEPSIISPPPSYFTKISTSRLNPPYSPPPYTKVYSPGVTPPYSPPPYSPGYTPPGSPPYSPPGIPTIQTPPPLFPPTFPWVPGSGGPNPFRRKRSSHFTEKFMVGLDMSIRGPLKGRSISPKRKKTPVKRHVRHS